MSAAVVVPAQDETELVLFEVLRERGRVWVRAKHRDKTRTAWHLISSWSEEIRAELLHELEQLRVRVL